MFLKKFQFELEFGTITDCAWRALRDSDSSLCKFVSLSFRRSRSTASPFDVHTESEMVCLAREGKLRFAHDASARKLATTAGSAFVGPIAVKS